MFALMKRFPRELRQLSLCDHGRVQAAESGRLLRDWRGVGKVGHQPSRSCQCKSGEYMHEVWSTEMKIFIDEKQRSYTRDHKPTNWLHITCVYVCKHIMSNNCKYVENSAIQCRIPSQFCNEKMWVRVWICESNFSIFSSQKMALLQMVSKQLHLFLCFQDEVH